MEDSQLKILIDKYDPAMSQQDVDYLMLHQDREAVINTLYAKLVEREQPHYDCQVTGDQYQDMDDGAIYYEDEIDGNYTLAN